MIDPQAEFERLLAELRPRLHRYCARMTGSVIDGEDVLQETLVKAIEAFPHTGPLARTATRRWRRSPIQTARSTAARPPLPACAP